jgi:hypothetical protein
MVKFVAFGDSFVNIFYALKSIDFEIIKFKGALIQGLVKYNDNYKKMIKILHKKKYDYGFFVFGNVDLNFYFFKKKYIDNVPENEIVNTILTNAKKYIELIKNLKNIKNKYVINVFPSTISDKNYKFLLKKYGVILEDKINNINNKNIIYTKRNGLVMDFNALLDKYSKLYNINFCNVYNLIVDSKYHLNKIFKLQHTELNIHFNNEYVLMVFIHTCLSFLSKYYDNIELLIKKTSDEYIDRLVLRNKTNYIKNRFNLKKIKLFIKNKLKTKET